MTDEDFNTHFFTLATELLDRLVVKVVENPSILKTLMILGPAVVSAYVISMASVHQDKDLLRQVESVAGIEKEKKVAWFTDRYHGVDGVVMTVKKFLAASFEYDCDLTVVISDDKTDHPERVKSFPSITDFQLPMYSNIVGKLFVPSFLRVARWIEEEEFDSVVISTPGPMGFAGMIAGKILGLPITAIYHTDLPRYSYELTGDSMLAGVVRQLTKAFYNQADRILVPSKHYVAIERISWLLVLCTMQS